MSKHKTRCPWVNDDLLYIDYHDKRVYIENQASYT